MVITVVDSVVSSSADSVVEDMVVVASNSNAVVASEVVDLLDTIVIHAMDENVAVIFNCAYSKLWASLL